MSEDYIIHIVENGTWSRTDAPYNSGVAPGLCGALTTYSMSFCVHETRRIQYYVKIVCESCVLLRLQVQQEEFDKAAKELRECISQS